MLLEVCAWDGDAKIRNDARSGRRRANVRRAEREADTSADDDCGFIDPPGRCGLRRADGPPRSMRAFLGWVRYSICFKPLSKSDFIRFREGGDVSCAGHAAATLSFRGCLFNRRLIEEAKSGTAASMIKWREWAISPSNQGIVLSAFLGGRCASCLVCCCSTIRFLRFAPLQVLTLRSSTM